MKSSIESAEKSAPWLLLFNSIEAVILVLAISGIGYLLVSIFYFIFKAVEVLA